MVYTADSILKELHAAQLGARIDQIDWGVLAQANGVAFLTLSLSNKLTNEQKYHRYNLKWRYMYREACILFHSFAYCIPFIHLVDTKQWTVAHSHVNHYWF